MKKRTKSIGVFDSGFGGISILKDIEKLMPEYRYVYLGDTARTPYGTRSPEAVYLFTRQAVDFLFAHGCDLIIVACNTASAEALRKIQQTYLPKKYPGKRVLGVIVPALEEATEVTKNKRVGVIGTEGAVKSGTFVREMRSRDASIKVFQQAAPLLVPLVEAGEHQSEAARLLLAQYLRAFRGKNIDTLILGCTHYGFFKTEIEKILGKKVAILSEGPIVARKLKEYLARHPDIEQTVSTKKGTTFFTTDLSDQFQKLGSLFFGERIVPKRAELESA